MRRTALTEMDHGASQEGRLREALQSVAAFTVWLDAAGKVAAVERFHTAKTGSSWIGQYFHDLPLFESTGQRELIASQVRKSLEGAKGRLVTQVCFGNSEPEFVELRFAPIGEGVLITALCATEPSAEARRLSESDAMLRALVEAAPIGIGLLDTEFRFLRVNPQLASMNGLSAQAHIGRTPKELLPDVHNLDDLYAVWRQVITTGRSKLGIEVGGATPASPNETRTWVEHFFPVTIDGSVQALAVVVEDVSQKRMEEAALAEKEARMRLMFTAIDEGYCICEMIRDRNGAPTDYRFLEVNPLFEAMTGLQNAVGQTARTLVPELEQYWIDTYARVGLGQETMRFEMPSAAMGRNFDVFAAPVPPFGRFALVFKDVTERKQAEARSALLINELNHRVKNILATIQAMASHTLRTAPSLEDFRSAFNGRLRAIAAAHDSIFGVDAAQGHADLQDLILKIVSPYGGSESHRLRLCGPRVRLDTARAHGLGLVLHELATNAAKYGALSLPTGRVGVSWRLELGVDLSVLRIAWREENGPPVKPPSRSGFGTTLIATALSAIPGAKTAVRYEPDGLCADIEMQL